jgi:hypothetical protein
VKQPSLQYWRERGYDVSVNLIEAFVAAMRSAHTDVRSDVRNGTPRKHANENIEFARRKGRLDWFFGLSRLPEAVKPDTLGGAPGFIAWGARKGARAAAIGARSRWRRQSFGRSIPCHC